MAGLRGHEGRTGASTADRCAAVVLVLGTALFGAGSLIHPPTARRGDLMHVVREGASAMWALDHWLLALASALVAIGLAGFHAAVSARAEGGEGADRPIASFALPAAGLLGTASAVFWIGLFVFEATGWPPVAAALAGERAASASPLYPVAQGMWSATLAVGYAAGVLLAAAIGLWSAALAEPRTGSRTDDSGGGELGGGIRTAKGSRGGTARGDSGTVDKFTARRDTPGVRSLMWAGYIAAAVGVGGQALAWVFPRYALHMLVPAAVALGLWLLLAALRLWQGIVRGEGAAPAGKQQT